MEREQLEQWMKDMEESKGLKTRRRIGIKDKPNGWKDYVCPKAKKWKDSCAHSKDKYIFHNLYSEGYLACNPEIIAELKKEKITLTL